MTRRSTSARTAALALATVTALGLAGCGGDDEAAATQPTPTSTATESAGSEPGGEGGETTGGSGRVIVESKAPSDYPSAAVPLYDAPVVAGAKGDPNSRFDWSVVLQSKTGEPPAVMAAITQQLEAKGFVAEEKQAMPTLQISEFSGDEYEASVTVVSVDGGVTVTYLVTTR